LLCSNFKACGQQERAGANNAKNHYEDCDKIKSKLFKSKSPGGRELSVSRARDEEPLLGGHVS
jgi:hypothetical protein